MTTRTPRPDERNGTDYTFLSKDEFLGLERSGELLESGVYDGKTCVCVVSIIPRDLYSISDAIITWDWPSVVMMGNLLLTRCMAVVFI